jgi:hypothetical protein
LREAVDKRNALELKEMAHAFIMMKSTKSEINERVVANWPETERCDGDLRMKKKEIERLIVGKWNNPLIVLKRSINQKHLQ